MNDKRNDTLKEMTTKLFDMAATTTDLRWKRYLLDEGRKLMAMQDPLEAEIHLGNLIEAAERGLRDAEGKAWLNGFLSALSTRGLK